MNLNKMTRKNKEFLIGTSGYFYWHWKKVFYPEDLPTYKWFEFYAERFDTVEINMTFYKWPKKSTLDTWKRKCKNIEKKNRRFLYSIKANKEITHIKKLHKVKPELEKFYGEVIKHIVPYVACILFQLPPSFKCSDDNKNRLMNFISDIKEVSKSFNIEVPVAIEFRHKSWWCEEVYQILKENNIAFCSVSAPNLPEEVVDGSFLYIRFHGKNRWYKYDYKKSELEKWARSIIEIIKERNKKDKKKKKSAGAQALIYFNNDYNGYAVKNAMEIRKIINKF